MSPAVTDYLPPRRRLAVLHRDFSSPGWTEQVPEALGSPVTKVWALVTQVRHGDNEGTTGSRAAGQAPGTLTHLP